MSGLGKNLSVRGASLKPSETLAIKAKAAELKAQGRSVIDFSAGEPEIDTPEFIKEAGIKAIRDGNTKYTAVPGIDALREAIVEKFSKDHGLKYAKNQVIVTNGGKQALHNALEVIVEEGDEIVFVSPYWVSYPSMVELAGGKPVVAKTRAEDGYKLKPETLKEVLSSRTKAVILNYPSNPTGVAYTESEVQALGEVIKASNALVVSDEIYEKITYRNYNFKSFAAACPELFDRTLTVNGFSKTYSMTGWRVGYLAGPKEVVEAMSRYQSQTTSNVCSIAQHAALAALKGPTDFLEKVKVDYRRRIEMGMEAVSSIPGLRVYCDPMGAFYLFISFADLKGNATGSSKEAVKSSAQFSAELLEKAGVAVVPGEAFGDDQAFRISVSCSDENVREGLARIRKGVETLVR